MSVFPSDSAVNRSTHNTSTYAFGNSSQLSDDSNPPSRLTGLQGKGGVESPTHNRMASNTSGGTSASMEPSTSYSSITDYAARYADSAPRSDTHSEHSSSSSLRHAYAALKGGVFPPGVRRTTRRDDDTSSDVSHYDDDDDGFSFENGGPFQPADSPPVSPSDPTKPSLSDMYINALDSPDVPQRSSSVSEQSSSSTVRSRQNRADTLSVNQSHRDTRRPSVESTTSHQTPRLRVAPLEETTNALVGQGVRRRSMHQRHAPSIGEEAGDDDSDNISPAPKQLTHPLSLSPSHGSQAERSAATKGIEEDSAASTSQSAGQESEVVDEAELQRRVEAEAAAADPNRPRTLKEARALAKERARLRSEAKSSFDLTNIASPSGISPPTMKPALPQRQGPIGKETHPYSPPTASEATRQEHRHMQVVPIVAAQGNDEPQLISRTSLEANPADPHHRSEGKSHEPGALVDMSDLQAAVGDALDDVSFSSSLSVATATGPTRSTDTGAAPGSARYDASPASNFLQPLSHKDTDGDSNAASVQSFDSAPESPTTNVESPYFSAVHIANVPAPTDLEQPQDTGAAITARATSETDGQPPSIQVIHTSNQFPRSTSFNKPQAIGQHASASDLLMTPTTGASFVPYKLHAQQRSTAPNKIARLDVYGKTVRWPPAFDPTAIIEQRRLAPWERARSYAHYCNDLTSTPTGIQVWLDMVQRPAQRVAAAAAASSLISPTMADFDHDTPNTRHLREEGTDGSTYAASVRSDATFPMRGDGGKAKELASQHPTEATIPESPTALPRNLPYPILAGGSSHPHSNSHSAIPASQTPVRHQARASQDSLTGPGLGSTVGGVGGERREARNFFTSLGRKTSVRRTAGSGGSMGSSGAAAALMSNSGSGNGNNVNSNSSPARNAISNIRARGISVPSSSVSSTALRSAPTDLSFISGRHPSAPSPYDQSLISAASTPNAPSASSTAAASSSPRHSPSLSSVTAARNLPQGPRAFANSPSYVGSLSESLSSVTSPTMSDKPGLHGLSTSGGIYSIPNNASSTTRLGAMQPTDYSSPHGTSSSSPVASTAMLAAPSTERRSPRTNNIAIFTPSPSVKSSLAYGSVRDTNRRPTLMPPTMGGASGYSSDSSGGEQRRGSATSGHSFGLGRRRSSNLAQVAPPTAEEDAALDKLSDVLPDADRPTLLEYLRKANGNDLVAIGDYLQDQSKAVQSKHMR